MQEIHNILNNEPSSISYINFSIQSLQQDKMTGMLSNNGQMSYCTINISLNWINSGSKEVNKYIIAMV